MGITNEWVKKVNLIRLKRLLDENGIDSTLYDLYLDKDSVYRIAEAPQKGYWEVYFWERGKNSERYFNNEDDAVHYFIKELTRRQRIMNDVKKRFEKRTPKAQLFLNMVLAVEYLVNEFRRMEQERIDIDSERPVIIKEGSFGTNKECRIINNLSWNKHISSAKRPSEFSNTDKSILARKLMIVFERTKRIPFKGEEIAEVTEQIDENTLLEEANKLYEEL